MTCDVTWRILASRRQAPALSEALVKPRTKSVALLMLSICSSTDRKFVHYRTPATTSYITKRQQQDTACYVQKQTASQGGTGCAGVYAVGLIRINITRAPTSRRQFHVARTCSLNTSSAIRNNIWPNFDTIEKIFAYHHAIITRENKRSLHKSNESRL